MFLRFQAARRLFTEIEAYPNKAVAIIILPHLTQIRVAYYLLYLSASHPAQTVLNRRNFVSIFTMSKGKGKDVLIDSHVSLRQCKLAVEALHSHSAKKEQKAAETELLPGKEQHLWLQVAVKKMQPEKKIKPFKMWVGVVYYAVQDVLTLFIDGPDRSSTLLSTREHPQYV